MSYARCLVTRSASATRCPDIPRRPRCSVACSCIRAPRRASPRAPHRRRGALGCSTTTSGRVGSASTLSYRSRATAGGSGRRARREDLPPRAPSSPPPPGPREPLRPQPPDRHEPRVVIQLHLDVQPPVPPRERDPHVPAALIGRRVRSDGDVARLVELVSRPCVDQLPAQWQALAAIALDSEVEGDVGAAPPEHGCRVRLARELLAVEVLAECDVAVEREVGKPGGLGGGHPLRLDQGPQREHPADDRDGQTDPDDACARPPAPGLLAQEDPEAPGQRVDVVVPARVGELARLPPGQRRQVRGKLVLLRHERAVDQHGDDLDVRALERPRDLAAHEVLGIVEAAVAVGVRHRRPALADDRKEHVAAVEQRLDVLVEVHPALHRYVAEGPARAAALVQGVVQASGPAARVGAPVADEDALAPDVAVPPRAVAAGAGRRRDAAAGASVGPAAGRLPGAQPPRRTRRAVRAVRPARSRTVSRTRYPPARARRGTRSASTARPPSRLRLRLVVVRCPLRSATRTRAAALTWKVTRTVPPRPRPRTVARTMRATSARRRGVAREPAVARNSAEIDVTGPTASEQAGAVPQAPRQRTNREPEPGTAISVSRVPKV